MKRTFSESWFVCLRHFPTAEREKDLLSYSQRLKTEYGYMDVITLQIEEISNSTFLEVIKKEDYEKYIHKDLKYIENLEKMLEEAKDYCQKILDNNDCLQKRLDDAQQEADKLYYECKDYDEALRVLNNSIELSYDGHHYTLSSIEKDRPINLTFDEAQALEKVGVVFKDHTGKWNIDTEFTMGDKEGETHE